MTDDNYSADGDAQDDAYEEAPALGQAVARLIGMLIDEPEEMVIAESTDGSGDRNYTARVAYDDLGKLIGRQGRTARALRSFLEVRGALDDQRYGLDIRE